MVNIRPDNFTGEIFINLEYLFTLNTTEEGEIVATTSRTVKRISPASSKQGGNPNPIYSRPFDNLDQLNSMYRVEIFDIAGKVHFEFEYLLQRYAR
jgi:hypothetical protein